MVYSMMHGPIYHHRNTKTMRWTRNRLLFQFFEKKPHTSWRRIRDLGTRHDGGCRRPKLRHAAATHFRHCNGLQQNARSQTASGSAANDFRDDDLTLAAKAQDQSGNGEDAAEHNSE